MSALSKPSHRWDYLPKYALAQLPRYTSYPPANRFTGFSAAMAETALASLPGDAPVSLYLHIPFCKKLCWYCGCNTSVPTLADPVASYIDALISEIGHVADRLPYPMRVTHIHFGGGSPDILEPHDIDRIFAALHTRFRIDARAEIAAELDPRGVNSENVRAFVAGGLNRASLGVQVLDRGVQTLINRVQPVEEMDAAIATLRRAGVANLNLDMMYGLPGQTMAHVVDTALYAATRDANRVATFGYAHVPWMKKHQKGIHVSDLSEGEERFRQAEAAAITLERAGYVPIGFDHFAAEGDSLALAERAGRLRRNFQGYTDDNAAALIGLGASSISSLPGVIFQNTPDTAAYRNAASTGLAVAKGIELSPEDVVIARVIERLLCDFEAVIPGRLLIRACPSLTQMFDDGLATLSGTRLTVTARGRPYVRAIAACFDPGLQPAQARHSTAV